MPESMGKPGDGPQGSITVGGVEVSAPDEGQTETYLATFKTKEDAAKGWEASQAEINRLRSEKDKALAAAEKASRNDALLEKLTALQEASLKSGKPQQPKFDKEAFIKQWEDGDANFQVSALEGLIADTAAKEELEALREEMRQMKAEMGAQMGEYDPNYLAHKETVAVLREQFPGVDRNTLVQFATYADSLKPSAPAGDSPLGTTAASRVSMPATTVQITPEAQALLNRAIPGGLRKGELEKAAARLAGVR